MDNIDFYLEDLKTKFNKINPNEYYLSYSGGKDSHLLYWFIKEYAKEYKDIPVISVNTYMEHKEIRERMYKYADKILLPKLKPQDIKAKYGTPCFSKEQDFYIYYYQNALRRGKRPSKTILDKINGTYKTGYSISKKAKEYLLSGEAHNITHLCCKYLKKDPFKAYEKETNRKAILGIKGQESVLRKRQYTSCFTKDKKFTPLFDLTEDLEEQIYKKYNIEVPKIYDYIKRTGCIGCPYGSYKGDTEKELELLEDNQYDFICDLFKESYKILGVNINRQMMIGGN